jgi:hypothetical protein
MVKTKNIKKTVDGNLPKCQTGIRGLDEITDGGI